MKSSKIDTSAFLNCRILIRTECHSQLNIFTTEKGQLKNISCSKELAKKALHYSIVTRLQPIVTRDGTISMIQKAWEIVSGRSLISSTFFGFLIEIYTVLKASKCRVSFAPYFSIFGLNTRKCWPEITLHLDTSSNVMKTSRMVFTSTVKLALLRKSYL